MTRAEKETARPAYDFHAYSVGICYASACTSLPIEEATARLNDEHPTGISSQWAPSTAPTFRQGSPNPCPCPDHPETHKHYLFNC